MSDADTTTKPTHWDRYKDTLTYSKLLEAGQASSQAIRVMAELNLEVDQIEEIIEYLSPDNVELYAHVHVTEDKAEMEGNDCECEDVDLGRGFKQVVVFALTVLAGSYGEGNGN